MKKVYLIAVVFALIAGFATYYFATQIDEKSTYKDADMKVVIVPSEDIPANTKITEDMLLDEEHPKFVAKQMVLEDASENAIDSLEQLVDKVTVDPLYAGEIINSNRVQDVSGASVALSIKLPKGKVAYSFAAGSVMSVDGYIREGDTVDVIVYEPAKEGEKEGKSSVKYKNLKILRVSTSAAYQTASATNQVINEYSTLTVEVTEKQALQLYKIENENTYKLVLNHRAEPKTEKAEKK